MTNEKKTNNVMKRRSIQRFGSTNRSCSKSNLAAQTETSDIKRLGQTQKRRMNLMNRMTNWQLTEMDKFILEINYNVKNWTEIKLYNRPEPST